MVSDVSTSTGRQRICRRDVARARASPTDASGRCPYTQSGATGLLQGAESWGLLFVLWARPPFCVSSILGEALHRLEIQSVCVVNFYLLFLFSTFFPTD